MRWPDLLARLPVDVRSALTTALAGGCSHACSAQAAAAAADDIDVTAEHLDAAIESLAQARELLWLTARVAREHAPHEDRRA